MKLAGQTGAAVSALLGGMVATLSYRYRCGRTRSWLDPTLLVLGVAEPPDHPGGGAAAPEGFKALLRPGAGQHDAARVPQSWSCWDRPARDGLDDSQIWQDVGVPGPFRVARRPRNLLSSRRRSAAARARQMAATVFPTVGVLPIIARIWDGLVSCWAGIVLGS